MNANHWKRIAVAIVSFGVWIGTALAQGYPSKPITVVVGYPPGGDTDAMARLFSEKLAARLAQSVVIENKPGAGTTIANSLVSRAAADGYTLLFTPNSFTIAQLVMKVSAPTAYDVLKGFEPIIHTGDQVLLLVANPSSGIASVKDMVASAKSGKPLSYGTPGAGSPMHIVGELLNRAAGIKIQHVAYRGTGPAVNDVVAGHIPLAYITVGPVAQYIETGKLVPLAVSDAKRSSLLPKVPTLSELGYKDAVAGGWHGFFAPKGTPREVVELLNSHLNEIIRMPDVVEKMANFGATPAGGPPSALAKLNATELQRMTRVIKELGVQAGITRLPATGYAATFGWTNADSFAVGPQDLSVGSLLALDQAAGHRR